MADIMSFIDLMLYVLTYLSNVLSFNLEDSKNTLKKNELTYPKYKNLKKRSSTFFTFVYHYFKQLSM